MKTNRILKMTYIGKFRFIRCALHTQVFGYQSLIWNRLNRYEFKLYTFESRGIATILHLLEQWHRKIQSSITPNYGHVGESVDSFGTHNTQMNI